jgi:hypothetical protein
MSKRATVIDGSSDGPTIEPVIIPTINTGDTGGNAGGTSDIERETINGFETIEPGDAAGRAAGSGSGKRRGRPPGSAAGAKKASKADIGGLESILFSLHMMGAAILDTPELVLDEGEAKALADAAAKVAGHYNHTIDPRTVAWVNLAMVAGGIYGTRVFAIRARHRAAQAGPKQAPPLRNVVDFKAGKTSAAAGPVAQTPADIYGLGYSGLTGAEFSAEGE